MQGQGFQLFRAQGVGIRAIVWVQGFRASSFTVQSHQHVFSRVEERKPQKLLSTFHSFASDPLHQERLGPKLVESTARCMGPVSAPDPHTCLAFGS